ALYTGQLLRLPWHVARCQLSWVRGYCSSVDCCVYPDTPLVASCQGSRGIVRRLVATSTLTRRLSPAVGGQGGWSSTSALLRRPLSGGTVSRSQGR
ncbi:hypothetical protein BHM03_00046196, partial [Ensete ventricosum]